MYGLKTSSSSSSRRTGSGEKGAAKLALPMFDIRNDQFEIPEFTEEDLMDPELLRELASLESPTRPNQTVAQPRQPVPKATAKPQPKKIVQQASTNADVDVEVDVDAVLSSIPVIKHDQDVEVEFTDADMDDPELLGELAELHGETGIDTRMAEATTNHGEDTHMDTDEIDDDLKELQRDMGPLHTNQTEVKATPVETEKVRRVLETSVEQKLVISADNSGDAMMGRVVREETVSNSVDVTDGDDTFSVSQSVKKLQVTDTSDSTFVTLAPTKPVTKPNATNNNNTLDILKRRQHEYKQAALNHKKSNDLARAREFLFVAKSLETRIESLALGGALPSTFEVPPPPALYTSASKSNTINNAEAARNTSSTMAAASNRQQQQSRATHSTTRPKHVLESTTSTTSFKSTSSSTGGVSESFDFKTITSNTTELQQLSTKSPKDIMAYFQTTLQSQIATCTQLSAYYYKSNQKLQALEIHKMKKSFLGDLETLTALQTTANKPSFPSIGYKEFSYTMQQEFSDIAVDEMCVEVIRGFGLSSSEVSSPEHLDTWVVLDPGWPMEDGKESERKGTSERSKSGDPEYSYKKSVKISRTRGFQRFLEKRKLGVEVFLYRGWLRRAVCLGKAALKLEGLLNGCEVHEVVDLFDATNPRKLAGGKIEIRVRLRTPLLGPEIVRKSEKWLFLDFSNPSESISIPRSVPSSSSLSVSVTVPEQQLQRQPSKSAIAQPSPISTTPKSSMKSPVSATSSVPTSASSSGMSNADEDAIEDAMQQFNNLDNVFSNEVLEHEKTQVETQIQSYQSKSQPIPDDLEFRRGDYQLKLDLLVMMVQTGQLTPEGYADKLKECVGVQKKLALLFKSLGKMDMAAKVLMRIKLMEKEIAELTGGEGV